MTSAVVINAYTTVPQALHQWEQWALSDSVEGTVAGFPKASITEVVKDFHLMELAKTRTYRTAQARQTKSVARPVDEEHPVAEAVEAAIVRMRQVKPVLYHVLLADRLCIVPVYTSGIDKQLNSEPHHYRFNPRRWSSGESEASFKRRLAMFLGMGASTFYKHCESYQLYVGTYLDLHSRYEVVEEPQKAC